MKCANLLDIFVSPGDVFDKIIAAPRNLANWRVPTLLVCLVAIISIQLGNTPVQLAATFHNLREAGTLSTAQSQAFTGAWPLFSALFICATTFAGTCWAAFVLWFIGRFFLKVRFPYLKALEVVGLTGTVLVLSSIVTLLLVAASGNPAAQPALSFIISGPDSSQRLHQILETLNFFHLWSVVVLAIGLSRLSGASFKEAAFWVFGYWLLTRITLVLLQ